MEDLTWVAGLSKFKKIKDALADFQDGKITVVDFIDVVAKESEYHGRCPECGDTSFHARDCSLRPKGPIR